MRLFKKILIVLIICGAVSIIFLTWYSGQHANEEVIPASARSEKQMFRILVAADRVETMDTLIREVIRGLAAEHVTIEVHNLSDLPEIIEDEWSAMVVFQKAGIPRDGSDRVSRIKTSVNGFLVTLHENHNYILEGGGDLKGTTLSGVELAAIQIVTRVQTALDQGN